MAEQQHRNRMGEHYREQECGDSLSLERCYQATEEAVRENPMISTVAAFGAGLALGAVIGSLLAEPAGLRHRQKAETIGRRMLDTFAESLPASVRHHLNS